MLYLPADGLGQFVDKCYYTWVFIRSGGLFHMLLKLPHKLLRRVGTILLSKYDCGLHQLPAYLVGHPGYRTLQYSLILH